MAIYVVLSVYDTNCFSPCKAPFLEAPFIPIGCPLAGFRKQISAFLRTTSSSSP